MTIAPFVFLLAASTVLQRSEFASHGPYDPAVPTPESVLGYGPGERHSTFRDQERVILAIAERAKNRVRVMEMGLSVEGRPLRLIAISSAKNMARLEDIRKAAAELADPAPGRDYSRSLAETPAIVWINECIHGDETASFESAMWLFYNLAASKSATIERILDDAVVLLNPVFNPDGHERFVVWYNGVAVGSSDPASFEHAPPGIARGRVNHYRFDLNRDRVTLSQDETRAEVAEFRRWNPQVYVDQHGQLENYFFPPNPMSINVNVDRDRIKKWTVLFGQATAAAFDRQGWLYFVRNEFDLYYPGYTDSWASLSGAVGMTHETDHGASIRRERRDGSTATLTSAMEKHFVSAMAVIRTAGEHRQELLSDFLKFKRDAATGKLAGDCQRVALELGTFDEGRLREILDRHGLRYSLVSSFVQARGHDFWSGAVQEVDLPRGALVIDMAQPLGPLAKSLFEPSSDFEPEFVKEQTRRRRLEKEGDPDPDAGQFEFYDMTGWSLAFGFGARAWWFESAPPLTPVKPSAPDPDAIAPGASAAAGYAVETRSLDSLVAVAQAAMDGLRVQVATRETYAGKSRIPPGTLLLLRGRNGQDLDQRVKALGNKGVRAIPLETGLPFQGSVGLGSGSVEPVKRPHIGVAFGDPANPSGFGSAWFVFERELKLPFTPLTAAALTRDLAKYSAIVFPPGRHTITPKLREWVQSGGCAVILGSPEWALGDSGFAKLEVSKAEGSQPAPLPGSLFLARLDARSFLSFGYPKANGEAWIAVPVEGSVYYRSGDKGESPLTMPVDPKEVKLLSGWAWPQESAQSLADTVWIHVESMGQGKVVMFFWDPTERALWPGHWRLLLNAILFGPR